MVGQTYNNLKEITEGDGVIDYHKYESRYRFEDFAFINHDREVGIYKGGHLVGAAPGQSVEYGQLSIRTFSFYDRDYFVIRSAVNCGNGGCEDLSYICTYANGTSTPPFKLWDNSWGWGHGGAKPYGSEDGGMLDFAIAFSDSIFLIPKGDFPIIQLGQNGKLLRSITVRTSTLAEILESL
jgi:hypothetical protein